jgi:DNA adenine methylase
MVKLIKLFGDNMKPILKWTGGKTSELPIIKQNMPSFDRVVEPFLGGGAFYFDLEKPGAVNDFNSELIRFYNTLKTDPSILIKEVGEVQQIKNKFKANDIDEAIQVVFDACDDEVYQRFVLREVNSKLKFIEKNDVTEPEDLILTAGHAAVYYWCRERYNNRSTDAMWYVMRENAYSGMFRFSSTGKFNVPYGGKSYNSKNLMDKLTIGESNFKSDFIQQTTFHNLDFEIFLDEHVRTGDFIFLDPPYDTEFSQYNKEEDFTKDDQIRLRDCLVRKHVPWMVVIKYTDFIEEIYSDFKILRFGKNYMVNMKNRNDRSVDHLMITNY